MVFQKSIFSEYRLMSLKNPQIQVEESLKFPNKFVKIKNIKKYKQEIPEK